jgi:thioredoxin-dependent peroxiredoxin
MASGPLQVGDIAPDFTLQNVEGSTFHLYSALGERNIVLFFFVKVFTPVCSAETCGFRDGLSRFGDHNAQVWGVSPDNEMLSRGFARFFRVPYPMLVDRSNQVRELYRVPKLFGILPGRATYVIGQDRRIKNVTTSSLSAEAHIEDSLRALSSEAASS